jgi:hypothetical protein
VLLASSFEGFRELLGEDSVAALAVAGNLALALANQGRVPEAITVQRMVAEGKNKRYGLEDERSLTAFWNLATWLHFEDQNAEAQVIAHNLLETRTRLLGADHEKTNKVAELLRQIDNSDEA